jgi:delta-aminolevulinic acid dehydratase/porphobilinogen synthase
MLTKIEITKLIIFALVILFFGVFKSTAQSQQIQWASESDPTVQMMVEAERKWAVIECVPSDVDKEFLAEDFVGTVTDGKRYSKADVLSDPTRGAITARACSLLSAHVSFVGDSVAMVYGSETSIRKDKNGKEFNRTLIWTDTWLKRNGKWQIIAVQDMLVPSP